MKRILLKIFLIQFVLGFGLTSCNPGASASTSTGTKLPAAASPTLTASPSPTPAPIPCNIAFESDRDGGMRDIFVMEADGSDPVNLTKHESDDWAPAWSPDGKQIAFVSNRGSGEWQGMFIFVMNTDGSGLRQLTMESDSNNPDWSNDGQKIVYESGGDVLIINADGSGGSINLTNSPAKDHMPSFSPDSRQIAWISDGDIFTMSPSGDQVVQVTHEGNLENVKWTQDGLLYTAPWNSKEHGHDKFVMNADGTGVKPAGGKGELYKYFPFWSEDGQAVECVDLKLDGKQSDIYLISEIYPDIFFNLSKHPAEDTRPDWPANCYLGRKVTAPKIDPTPTQTPAATQTPTPMAIKTLLGFAEQGGQPPYYKDNFAKACKELNIECQYDTLAALLDKGVTAIIQNSRDVDLTALEPEIRRAKEKGVPVFLLDTEIELDGAVSITINHDFGIILPVNWILEKMDGKGEFAYFTPSDKDSAANTIHIINKLLEPYPQVQVVDFKLDEMDRNKIKPVFHEFLKEHPNLKGFWSSHWQSEFLLGVADNKKPGDNWPAMNCEETKAGLYIWKDRLSQFPKMQCIAVSNPPGIAYEAAYAAHYLTQGYQFDPNVLIGANKSILEVPMPNVTNENLLEWIKKVNADDDEMPINGSMTPEQILERWFLEK